jgi:hypothetical protein
MSSMIIFTCLDKTNELVSPFLQPRSAVGKMHMYVRLFREWIVSWQKYWEKICLNVILKLQQSWAVGYKKKVE